MALPFRRRPVPMVGNPDAFVGPWPGHSLRAWEVEVLLWPLSGEVQEALRDWLLRPTDLLGWPRPETFQQRRSGFGASELSVKSLDTWRRLLYNELRAIRQTLDLPPGALSGLTRNGLLAVHALRLRQLERQMWSPRMLRLINEMIP